MAVNDAATIRPTCGCQRPCYWRPQFDANTSRVQELIIVSIVIDDEKINYRSTADNNNKKNTAAFTITQKKKGRIILLTNHIWHS